MHLEISKFHSRRYRFAAAADILSEAIISSW